MRCALARARAGRSRCPVLALLGLCLNFGAAVRAHAQSTRADSLRRDSVRVPQQLSAVVVTASGRLQRVTDAPVTTEVVSRADIERSGASDLNALLTQFVGLQPQPSAIGSGGVQIEGLSSERVLVLVDGQPVTGRIDGELDLSRIPAWMVDHVEVVKGPLSTLYGSAAMGGVVNVITRNGMDGARMLRAAITGGTQGRLDANLAARGGGRAWNGAVGMGRRTDDVQPGRTDQAGARTGRWDGNAAWHWAPAATPFTVDATLLGVLEGQRWQTGQLYNFSDNSQLDGRVTIARASAPDAPGGLAATLYYSGFTHLSREATLPEPVSDSGDFSRESLARMQLTYTGIFPRGVVDAGLDVDRDALASPRISGGQRTDWTVEPYTQVTLAWGRFTAVPGARVSSSSQWGVHVTPKLATMTRLGGGVTLRLSGGAGYRAPAFKEQYLTFLNGAAGYVVHGNDRLTPETSRNLTAGIEWTGGRAYARVQGFGNWFSGFIESVALPDSGGLQSYTYANVTRGITRGVDLDAGMAWRHTALDASAGFVYARDRSNNRPLLGVTPQSARVAATFRLPAGVRSAVTALYWGSAPASFATFGLSTTVRNRAPFTRLDLNFQRPLLDGVELQVGVTNLLNTRPDLWPGATDRRVYAGVSAGRSF